jgi:hypothetical protein
MKGPLLDNRLQRFLPAPSVASLLAAMLLFSVCIGILHPRYAINDDLKIISIAAGYPAATPAPFLVFSNVMLGLLVLPLYALHTPINWEIWLFSAVDLLSVWALLYILFSQPIETRSKLLGAFIIVACSAYFALNITFTNAASLSCFAGLCLILMSVWKGSSAPPHRTAAFSGIALVVMASLIRIEMLVLTAPLIVAALVFIFRSLRLRNLVVVLAVTGLGVFAGYAFDRLYVRAHPDWNSYYFYNKTAQKLQDAHRLENAGFTIKHISWSGNDQELFARSFFPDARIYTVERIQYLIGHVPGTGQNPVASIKAFSQRLMGPAGLPLLVTMMSIWLLALTQASAKKSLLALTGILAVSLGENLGLIWVYKNPDYVLYASLAQTAILEVLILYWSGAADLEANSLLPHQRLPRLADYGAMLVIIVVIGMLIGQSIATSNVTVKREMAYDQILADLKQLQGDGKIAPNALIISPSHGIPWEWSNPLKLDFPGIPFLDTGWSTFSPPYEEALRQFGIDSLPEALYQKSNIYLMTKMIFQEFLARYYQEHLHITVTFEPIYNMPNRYHVPEYDNVQLYRVVQAK